jgi:putative acetyltransferase
MDTLIIRPYRSEDQEAVKAIFIDWNRHLAGSEDVEAFETYIRRVLDGEILHITEFYQHVSGSGFWVADLAGVVVGMAGIEHLNEMEGEVRRMYVDSGHRRRGIGIRLLSHIEDFCVEENYQRILLSTSELQEAALALYRVQGYTLVREEVAMEQNMRTMRAGIRRFHFVKELLNGIDPK